MEAENIKFNKMTNEPVEKLIVSLGIPAMISMLVTSVYNMADTYFVSKLGTSATGAVGIVFSLMAIIQACGFFFGHGSGNYISRQLGKKNKEDADRMAATGFFSAFMTGILVMVLGLVFLVPLAKVLGSTDTILPYATDYLQIILFGAPYMTASLVLNNQLRFQGSAAYGMVGIASGAVLNIALDPLFIFQFNMGIKGAALATIISQFVGFILLLRGCYLGENIRIRIKNFTPCIRYYKEIFAGGMPSLCRQGLASIAVICLNLLAGFYGDAAIAAMSIVSRITMFASSALIGFGQGFQPVCGFNYGAGLCNRVKDAFWFGVKVSSVVLLAIAALGYIFAPDLVGFFRKDDLEVIQIGTIALRAQCLTLPLNGFIVFSNMMMQTIRKAIRASFLAMARQGLFFIPIVCILANVVGIFGIEIAQPIADLLTLVVTIPLQLGVLKEMKEELINNKEIQDI